MDETQEWGSIQQGTPLVQPIMISPPTHCPLQDLDKSSHKTLKLATAMLAEILRNLRHST